MKPERCSFRTSAVGEKKSGGTERQCLLLSDHVNDFIYEGPHRLKQKKSEHELAPICEHCKQVMPSWPGNEKNERFPL